MHAQFDLFGNSWLNWRQNYIVCSVSCALIYDDVIWECTVTADRTGKFVLLAYSLTASHCSVEAHLAGVPFPRSCDSHLALRQSWSTRLKSLVLCGCKKILQLRVLIKPFLIKKKGTESAVLSRVAKGVAKLRSRPPQAPPLNALEVALDKSVCLMHKCKRDTSHKTFDLHIILRLEGIIM